MPKTRKMAKYTGHLVLYLVRTVAHYWPLAMTQVMTYNIQVSMSNILPTANNITLL